MIVNEKKKKLEFLDNEKEEVDINGKKVCFHGFETTITGDVYKAVMENGVKNMDEFLT